MEEQQLDNVNIEEQNGNLEIERKWLIDPNNIPYDLNSCKKTKIEQSYINFSPVIRIRNIDDNEYILTIKSKTLEEGLVREEYECSLTKDEYDKLLSKKEGNTISKIRYFLKEEDGLTREIDIFLGDLEGLAYLEIEFLDLESAQNFETPNWVIKDVTADPLYKNSCLARFGIPKKQGLEDKDDVIERLIKKDNGLKIEDNNFEREE